MVSADQLQNPKQRPTRSQAQTRITQLYSSHANQDLRADIDSRHTMDRRVGTHGPTRADTTARQSHVGRQSGPFTPSASTSVYVRRRMSTDVDVRRRTSTDVDARLRRYRTHAKKRARSHRARLRPSTDVDGRLRPSTPC